MVGLRGNSLETPMFGVCPLFTPTFRNSRLHPNVWGFVFFSPRGFYRAELAATWTPRQQLTVARREFFSLFFSSSLTLSSSSHSSLPAHLSLSLSLDGNFRRREERMFSLFFSSFSHSLLLFLTFFLACASLSLSLATEISVARREFFSLFFSSSLTLSSSSHSSSPARLSLSRDENFRREERIFFSLLLFFSHSLLFLTFFLACASLSLSRDGNFRREERIFFSLLLFFVINGVSNSATFLREDDREQAANDTHTEGKNPQNFLGLLPGLRVETGGHVFIFNGDHPKDEHGEQTVDEIHEPYSIIG